MTVARRMERKLQAAFAPVHLEIKDESHLHVGHAGARPGGESHFRLLIVADAFEGLPRLARQRAVNAVLKEELAGEIHALAVVARAPSEERG